MPESDVYLRIRTALFLVLARELRGRAFVGSEAAARERIAELERKLAKRG